MTLVLDASALAEYLVGSAVGVLAGHHMHTHEGELHLPHLAVIETASVLRAWVRLGDLSEERAFAALEDLRDLPARRWPGEPLLGRIWELRDNVTAYDATYIALAEILNAEVLTTDGRLARGGADLSTCNVVTLTAATERG